MTEKVLAFLQEHAALPNEGSHILAAVSGGADSMCLLQLLQEISPRFHWQLSVAHYNHSLRGAEADRDENFVRHYCLTHRIPFFAERGDVAGFAARQHLGTEEAARVLRYDFLSRVSQERGCTHVATAHNADDNAETVLMHLVRGTGTAGLQGIPVQRGNLIRPLLCLTRKEIIAYNELHSLAWVEDSSNAEDVYTRNRIRHQVLPILEELNPRFSQACRRLSDLAQADEKALSLEAERFCRPFLSKHRLPCGSLLELPAAVAGRVIRLMTGQELSLQHVQSILSLCHADGSAASVSIPGMIVRAEYGFLCFQSGTVTPLETRPLPSEGTLLLPEAGLQIRIDRGCAGANIHKSFTKYLFKTDEVYGTIFVRHRLPGDRYRPRGRGCTKSLKSLMAEARIPESKRDTLPVLMDEKGILAVHPFGPAQRGLPQPGDPIIQIQFQEMQTYAE